MSRVGFPWPIIDPRTGVFTGLCPRWSFLVVRDRLRIVLTPSVNVQLKPRTSLTGRRRLDLAGIDGLGRTIHFFDGEVDGRPHIGAEASDQRREEEVDLPTLRCPQSDLQSREPLIPRLVAFVAALPNDPRARKPLAGPWL